MADETSAPALAASARRLALICGAAVAVLGLLVLLAGWGLGVARSTTLIAGAAGMKANTALTLILEGVALMCLTSLRTAVQRAGQCLGIAGALIGGLSGLQHIFGIDLGIDELLVADETPSAFPGRMAPLTAANVVAMGLGLYAARLPRVWMSHAPVLFVAFTSFVTLIGYGYGTSTLYSFGSYGTVSFHTALAFVILAVGVIAVRDHDGITGILRGPGPGGQLARRFILLALLLPPTLGWLRLIGQQAGLYDTPFGVALFAVTLTVILLVVTISSAAWLDRSDLQRQRMLHDLDSARRDALEREINLAAVVDSSDDAIVGCSVTGTIRTWNGGAERLYGYTADEAIGQSIRILVPPELHSDLERMMTACASGENIRNVQTVRLAKGGTHVDVSISAAPIRSASGAVIGLSAIARDIREQLQILRKLELQTAELQRSNDELTQFAYVASHDLQEPLRMVASYTELLSSRYGDRLDDRGAKYMGYISEGALRMQRLIRELLTFARVGTRPNAHVPVHLNEVMTNVLRDLKPRVQSTKAEIVVADLPTVFGDDLQLGQVLQNLVGNAIKFHHADRPPRVKVEAQRDGHMWCVSVEDNGIGIDMKFHDRVFEIFRRLHDRDSHEGTGVGLAIVKRIVERHGGRVWFESELGQHTTFRFTVPAADHVKDL